MTATAYFAFCSTIEKILEVITSFLIRLSLHLLRYKMGYMHHANHPNPSQQLKRPSDPTDPLKSQFLRMFVLVALMLMALPFWLPLQDLLTHLIIRLGWYQPLQQFVVPYELRYVLTFLTWLGVPVKVGRAYLSWQAANGNNEAIYFIWNCVGWQSYLLFFITASTGLAGKHTLISKGETFLLGLMGTYLFTMLRLMADVLIYYQFGRPFGIVFHDYLLIFLTFGYLAGFWWFACRFVLKNREDMKHFPIETD